MLRFFANVRKYYKIIKNRYYWGVAGMPKEIEIGAVYEDDLPAFLTSLEIAESFYKDELRCYFCGKPVTTDNLGSIFPKDNDIKVSCSSFYCTLTLLKITER